MSAAVPTPTRAGSAPPAAGSRGPVLVEVALAPIVLGYVGVVVLAAVVTGIAGGTSPGGGPGLAQAPALGVPLWLAAHLVPLRIGGAPLGVLPILPAVALGVLVAGFARRGARRLGNRAGAVAPLVATVTASHAAMGVLAAALLTPDAVIDASPARAGLGCGLLAGVAALAGVAGPCGLAGRLRLLPGWARAGLRAGLVAAGLLLAAGAAALSLALVLHAPAVAAVFTGLAPQVGSGAGLTLLCLGYLPNAVVGGTAWVTGPGVSIGALAASPTSATPGPLPPLPLAAALPEGPPPSWAGLVFAVPLAVGSVVGWMLATSSRSPRDVAGRLRALAVATVTAAAVVAVLAGLAGGDLGTAPFDPVSASPVGVLLAVLGWVAVPGAVVALLAAPTGTAPRRPAARRRPAPAARRDRRRPSGERAAPARQNLHSRAEAGEAGPSGTRPARGGREPREDVESRASNASDVTSLARDPEPSEPDTRDRDTPG